MEGPTRPGLSQRSVSHRRQNPPRSLLGAERTGDKARHWHMSAITTFLHQRIGPLQISTDPGRPHIPSGESATYHYENCVGLFSAAATMPLLPKWNHRGHLRPDWKDFTRRNQFRHTAFPLRWTEQPRGQLPAVPLWGIPSIVLQIPVRPGDVDDQYGGLTSDLDPGAHSWEHWDGPPRTAQTVNNLVHPRTPTLADLTCPAQDKGDSSNSTDESSISFLTDSEGNWKEDRTNRPYLGDELGEYLLENPLDAEWREGDSYATEPNYQRPDPGRRLISSETYGDPAYGPCDGAPSIDPFAHRSLQPGDPYVDPRVVAA